MAKINDDGYLLELQYGQQHHLRQAYSHSQTPGNNRAKAKHTARSSDIQFGSSRQDTFDTWM
jgi:hypothetical protein